jgi:hypothetical protein
MNRLLARRSPPSKLPDTGFTIRSWRIADFAKQDRPTKYPRKGENL